MTLIISVAVSISLILLAGIIYFEYMTRIEIKKGEILRKTLERKKRELREVSRKYNC